MAAKAMQAAAISRTATMRRSLGEALDIQVALAEAAAEGKPGSDGMGDPSDCADAAFTLPDDDLHGAGVLGQHLMGALERVAVGGVLKGLERGRRAVSSARVEGEEGHWGDSLEVGGHEEGPGPVASLTIHAFRDPFV